MGLIDSSITWSGKNAEGFYSTALLTGNTKSKIRLIPNVKSKVNLASLDLGNILQADACEVSASGNYTLDQKVLEVCDLAFKIQLCAKDYESLYLSEMLRPGSNVEENYPNGFVDYLFGQIAAKISEQTEALIFKGDTAGSPATLCDGFQKKFLADSAVVDVAVDGTKLQAASTVIGELKRMYSVIPNTILDKPLALFVNNATAQAYKIALADTHPALYAYNNANLGLSFLDIPMIVAPGLGAHKAVICDPNNLWYGTDLASDENEVSLITDPLNPKINYVIGSFKWGVEYAVGAEIVYYN